VLLDTCAVIWLANGDALASSATAAILHAGAADGIFVSPVSAWEVGLLSKPKAGRNLAVQFMPDPKTWFARVMAGPGLTEASLTSEIAIDASFLLGELHGDPAAQVWEGEVGGATNRLVGPPHPTLSPGQRGERGKGARRQSDASAANLRTAGRYTFPGQPCAVRERSLVLNASWPLSRTAGEGGERSETGEGFAAFQIFSRHSARGALVVSRRAGEGFATAKSVAPRPHCIAGERAGSQGRVLRPGGPLSRA
jgi:PIN domain nuclease of toxin-antitoxin system